MQPKFRCATKAAIDAVAEKLQLPNNATMQDWAYTLRNPSDIELYIAHCTFGQAIYKFKKIFTLTFYY